MSSRQERRSELVCPVCGHLQSDVIDSRGTLHHRVIRRRRRCHGCKYRYTTRERLEDLMTLDDVQQLLCEVQRALDRLRTTNSGKYPRSA